MGHLSLFPAASREKESVTVPHRLIQGRKNSSGNNSIVHHLPPFGRGVPAKIFGLPVAKTRTKRPRNVQTSDPQKGSRNFLAFSQASWEGKEVERRFARVFFSLAQPWPRPLPS